MSTSTPILRRSKRKALASPTEPIEFSVKRPAKKPKIISTDVLETQGQQSQQMTVESSLSIASDKVTLKSTPDHTVLKGKNSVLDQPLTTSFFANPSPQKTRAVMETPSKISNTTNIVNNSKSAVSSMKGRRRALVDEEEEDMDELSIQTTSVKSLIKPPNKTQAQVQIQRRSQMPAKSPSKRNDESLFQPLKISDIEPEKSQSPRRTPRQARVGTGLIARASTRVEAVDIEEAGKPETALRKEHSIKKGMKELKTSSNLTTNGKNVEEIPMDVDPLALTPVKIAAKGMSIAETPSSISKVVDEVHTNVDQESTNSNASSKKKLSQSPKKRLANNLVVEDTLSRLTRRKKLITEQPVKEADPLVTSRSESSLIFVEEADIISSEDQSFSSSLTDGTIRWLEDILSNLKGKCPVLENPKTQEEFLNDVPYLPGLKKDWEKDIRWVLDRTVRYAEGNCVLLIGPRGVGKSLIVNRNLKLLESVHGNDSFVTIKLSGLSETNDRLVLKEIARQLRGNEGYLSVVTDDANDDSFATYASILQTLVNILEPQTSTNCQESELRQQKPIIFVLDEFDQFALQSRQSFLYCLLDCVQGRKRKGGMLVLGLSSRTDCLDALEKRVKSRCQSRVHQIMHEGSLGGLKDIVRWVLKPKSVNQESLFAAWDKEVEDLLQSSSFLSTLEYVHAIDPCNRSRLMNIMYPIISRLYDRTINKNCIKFPCLNQLISYKPTSDGISFLHGLTTPEICVLIASKHLTLSNYNFNLPILYDVYMTHCKRGTALKEFTKIYSRNVFTKAYERLRSLDILLPVADAPLKAYQVCGVGNGERFKMVRLASWVQSVDKMVLEGKDVPESLKSWCRKWAS